MFPVEKIFYSDANQAGNKEDIMQRIGIIGSGIAGLHLGLFLQKHGVDATLYSDRSPEQIRAGRLSNFVVRFDPTRERERALDVDHQNTSLADELIENFGVPERNWEIIGSPEGTAKCLSRHAAG